MRARLPENDGPKRAAQLVDRLVRWLACHWLALFNIVVAVFVGLPFLAPVLAHAGVAGPARLIYAIYSPTCHQLPERSIFLFGFQTVYAASELEARGALPAGLNLFQRMALRFNGQAEIGHKIAICQRDIAIYGGILLNGLVFGALRGKLARGGRRPAKMPLWLFAILAAPMFLDGATQLVGWRESWWLLRLGTGFLFGAAVVWLAYPFVQDAMQDALLSGGESRPYKAIPQTGQKPPPAV